MHKYVIYSLVLVGHSFFIR